MPPILVSSVIFSLGVALGSASLLRRDGPYGTLVTPVDGTNWANTGGYGLGLVTYMGVDEDYNYGNITHVRTQSIDISLQSQDGSDTVFYLARGINPNPQSHMVNESFQIPYSSGTYFLVIEETQECQTPNLPPITFKAASPSVIITANSSGAGQAGRIEMSRSLSMGVTPNSAFQHARGGPSGSLNMPSDGTVWNNTNGFGSGRVQYQGIDQNYTSGNITHVTTHSIDIYLEADDNSPAYYLAKGIAPKSLLVDVEFQIPSLNNSNISSYMLVINETQECQSPELPPIIFRAAAPFITIFPPTPISSASPSGNEGMGHTNVGAIAGGVVGALAALSLIGALVFVLFRQKRRERTAKPYETVDLQAPTADQLAFIPTPYDLHSDYILPPEYTAIDSPSPPSTPGKSRFSGTTTPVPSLQQGHSRGGSASSVRGEHSRSISGGSERFLSSPGKRKGDTGVGAPKMGTDRHPLREQSSYEGSADGLPWPQPTYAGSLDPLYEQHIPQDQPVPRTEYNDTGLDSHPSFPVGSVVLGRRSNHGSGSAYALPRGHAYSARRLDEDTELRQEQPQEAERECGLQPGWVYAEPFELGVRRTARSQDGGHAVRYPYP